MTRLRIIALALALLCLLCAVSCSDGRANNTENGVSFADDLGREVSISADDKIAALHASFADCWLLAEGELVGVTSDAVEDHGLSVGDAAIVGTAKTVNVEALVSCGATVALLSADLVAHVELEPTLEALGIECVYFRVDTFSDYDRVMRTLCSITGRADLYGQNVTLVGERIEQIRERVPEGETRSVLLMRVYSSGIKAKSADNLAGLILSEFGLRNIADEYPSMLEDMSIEHIVMTDPDYILVLTMGSEESARKYLEENFESNPAFASLGAVKEGRYHILPKELFHYKPNEKWCDSYEYLARVLYPSVFDGQ